MGGSQKEKDERIRTRRKRSHDPALSYRFWKPTRGPSTSTRSPLLFFERWRHENTRALARELPPGGGPFHVGGSRVPGPNTFLIEMFIGGTTRNRPQSMKGKRFITATSKLAIKKECLRDS